MGVAPPLSLAARKAEEVGLLGEVGERCHRPRPLEVEEAQKEVEGVHHRRYRKEGEGEETFSREGRAIVGFLVVAGKITEFWLLFKDLITKIFILRKKKSFVPTIAAL